MAAAKTPRQDAGSGSAVPGERAPPPETPRRASAHAPAGKAVDLDAPSDAAPPGYHALAPLAERLRMVLPRHGNLSSVNLSEMSGLSEARPLFSRAKVACVCVCVCVCVYVHVSIYSYVSIHPYIYT